MTKPQKATHTPGPWLVRLGHTGYVIRDHEDDKTADRIATVHNGINAGWGDEALANARLIAAAPDLLEAAEAGVAVLEVAVLEAFKLCPHCGQVDDLDGWQPGQAMRHTDTCYFPALIAAIAKARGNG